MTDPTRILIGAADPSAAQGFRSVLSIPGGTEIVGEATDGPGVVEATKVLAPDLVVMEIGMPRLNGIEATRAIRHRDPAANVILVGVEGSGAAIVEAIQAGVAACLRMDPSPDELMRAVNAVLDGGRFISPELVRVFVDVPQQGTDAQRTNGPDLAIPPETVKRMLDRIFERLGAKDKEEALEIVRRNSEGTPPEP